MNGFKLIFKFNLKQLQVLQESLNYLDSLSYKLYNFSIRDIPLLILDTNPHTKVEKQWSTSDNLINEILLSSKLDTDGDNIWGYVYCKY